MTVADVIEKLQQFPLDQQVQITDGFESKCYKGDFAFQLFKDVDKSTFVDIGIGGCQYA